MTLALVHWHIGISFAMDCRVARAATAKPALTSLTGQRRSIRPGILG
jgi:hypothetical protein